MRFLCVQCDEALTFVESKGPDEGSLTAVFRCPTCGRDIAMLTNPQETQLVRSLHVQIGGRTVPPEPMEAIRGSLFHSRMPEQQATSELVWTAEAKERVERIPPFVRGMVLKAIEAYAQQQGLTEITPNIVDEAKGSWGDAGAHHQA